MVEDYSRRYALLDGEAPREDEIFDRKSMSHNWPFIK
jgi:hypothetical protein